MIYNFVRKSELECGSRLDAEYYDPRFVELAKKLDGMLRLSEICDVFTGASASEVDEGGSVFYVRVGDFGESGVEYKKCLRVRGVERMVQVKDGDVLVTRKGRVGSVDIVYTSGKKVVVSSEVIVLRVIDVDLISPHYLCAYLRSAMGQGQIWRLVSGTFMPSITQSELMNIRVMMGSDCDVIGRVFKDAKELIVGSSIKYEKVLRMIDDEVDEISCANDNLGFNVQVSEVWSARVMDVKRFLCKPIEGCVLLRDVAEVMCGDDVGEVNYVTGGVAFVRVGNVGEFGLVSKDGRCISEEMFKSMRSQVKIKKGDVILTKDGTVGVASVIVENLEAVISGGIVRLLVDRKKVDSCYLALVINSRYGQDQIDSMVSGSNIRHLSVVDIKRIALPLIRKNKIEKMVMLYREAMSDRRKGAEMSESVISDIVQKFKKYSR